MANKANIEASIKKIIGSQLAYDGEIELKHNFVDDLGADSLDTVELVMGFEEEFGINIPDTDAEKIATVEDAVNYIAEHSESE